MTYETYTIYRDKKKLNDLEVATKIGINSQSIYQWKHKQTTLKFETQKKIAELLKIPFRDFVKS